MNQQIPHIDELTQLIKTARLHLAKDGHLVQVAFMWTGENVAVIGGRPLYDNVDKIVWSKILRRMVMDLQADALFTMMEVWAVNVDHAPTPDDLMQAPNKNTGGAYEAIMFSLETMDGSWVAVCPIIRMEGQGPAFAMPRFWVQGQASGTMFNIIPDKNAQAYRPLFREDQP